MSDGRIETFVELIYLKYLVGEPEVQIIILQFSSPFQATKRRTGLFIYLFILLHLRLQPFELSKALFVQICSRSKA